jgi:hypothetical protein
MGLQILGQLFPAGSANELLFTAEGECVISSLMFCNIATASEEVRVFVIPAGEAGASQNALYYDMDLPGKTTFSATVGITMKGGDIVVVYSKLGTVAFHAFGQYK